MPLSKLDWLCMDDPYWKLDDYSLKPLAPPLHHTVETDEIDYQDYTLVVTGDVFRWMINHAALETLQRVCSICLLKELSLTLIFHLADACQNADLCTYVSRREERSGRTATNFGLLCFDVR